MKYYDFAEILRSTPTGPDQGFREVIALAAQITAESDSLIGTEDLAAQHQFIKIAAQQLASLPLMQRHEVIMEWMDHIQLDPRSNLSIRRHAAAQILKFTERAKSICFDYPAALYSCLVSLGQSAHKAQSSDALKITYRSPFDNDCALVRNVSQLLQLDSFTSVEKCWPWESRLDEQIDLILSMPPFGMSVPDFRSIPAHTLAALGIDDSFKGRLSIETLTLASVADLPRTTALTFVSDGALFRMVGIETIARRNLIDSGRLQAIMSIPPSLVFSGTGIKTSMLVVSTLKNAPDTTKFINLGHDELVTRGTRARLQMRPGVRWIDLLQPTWHKEGITRDVERSEILENNCVLNAERYLGSQAEVGIETLLQKHETRLLAEVAELIRPVSLLQHDEGEYKVREVRGSDISESGYIRQPERLLLLERGAYLKALNQKLQPGDLVISIKGSIGNIGLVPVDVPDEHNAELWSAGQSMLIIRLRPSASITPQALYNYMTSPVVQDFIRSRASGATIQNLAIKDLKDFQIPMVDASINASVQNVFDQKEAILTQIEELRQKLEEIKANSWPQNLLDERRDE